MVPTIASTVAGETIATRTRFWVTYRWHWLINTIAITLVAALLVIELLLLIEWVISRIGDDRDLVVTLRELGGAAAPWLVGNVFAGILLLPVGWSVHRRRIAERVRARRISDVIRQTRIESARKRAADVTAARRIGVSSNW